MNSAFRRSCIGFGLSGATTFSIYHNKAEAAASARDSFKEGTLFVDDEKAKSLRPGDGYIKIDAEPRFDRFINGHAIYDSLAGKSKIEFYEVYKNIVTNDLYCVLKFGDSLNGHPGIVHGGITALLFDNTFGWLFFARHIPVGVTANLNVNYRAPVVEGTYAILTAKVDKIEGRKLYFSASLSAAESGMKLADATSLFIMRKE